MRNLLRGLSCCLLLLAGPAWAHHVRGLVLCDDGDGEAGWNDQPIAAGVVATASSTNIGYGVVANVWGDFLIGLPVGVSDLYTVGLTGVGLPASATIIQPPGGTYAVNI